MKFSRQASAVVWQLLLLEIDSGREMTWSMAGTASSKNWAVCYVGQVLEVRC